MDSDTTAGALVGSSGDALHSGSRPRKRRDQAEVGTPHPSARRPTQPGSDTTSGNFARDNTDAQEAISIAFSEHQRSLILKARSIVFDDETAQDIVQQAFERACKHPQGFFSQQGSVRSWLLTITQNAAIDHIRRERSRPSSPMEDPHPQGETPRHLGRSREPVVRDHAQQVADRHTLLTALDQISPVHRQILQLIYFFGHTPSEAAEILSIPPGTARSRNYNALRELKSALDRLPARPTESSRFVNRQPPEDRML